MYYSVVKKKKKTVKLSNMWKGQRGKFIIGSSNMNLILPIKTHEIAIFITVFKWKA